VPGVVIAFAYGDHAATRDLQIKRLIQAVAAVFQHVLAGDAEVGGKGLPGR